MVLYIVLDFKARGDLDRYPLQSTYLYSEHLFIDHYIFGVYTVCSLTVVFFSFFFVFKSRMYEFQNLVE